MYHTLRSWLMGLLLGALATIAFPPLYAQEAGANPPVGSVYSRQAMTPDLSCSPKPCVLPNVQVSAAYFFSSQLALNPSNAQQLMIGDRDQSCPGTSGASYSTSDGGASWTRSCVLGAHPGVIYTPIISYGRDGTAYATATGGDQNTYVFQSADNGATWGAAQKVVGKLLQFSTSASSFQIDNNPSSPFVGRMYVATIQDDGPGSAVAVSISSDGGNAWKSLIVGPPLGVLRQGMANLAIGKDGSVYLAWLSCGGDQPPHLCGGLPASVWFTKSSDGGSKWSTPLVAAGVTLVPGNCNVYGDLPGDPCTAVYDVPILAVDNSNGPLPGRLYAVMYNWTGTSLKVVVVHSSDGGNTWSTPIPVAPPAATGDQFSAFVAVSSTGLVGVTWLDRRDDPKNIQYRPFAGFSRDGGATFVRNAQIGKVPLNPGGPWLGPTSAAWNRKVLYSSWQDTRNGAPQLWLGGIAF